MKLYSNKFFLGSVSLIAALCFIDCSRHARLEPQVSPDTLKTMGRPQGQPPVTPQAPSPAQQPGSAPQPQASGDALCRPGSVSANKIVKVLFVIDASGSNRGEAGSIPSDPGKKWRSETIRNFLNHSMNKQNFYYGMTVFKGTTAKSKINVEGVPTFSNDQAVVEEGFDEFMHTSDAGNTPYKAALTSAKDIIKTDMEVHPEEKASYAVVMISDGHATDYKHPYEVIPDALSVKSLAPDRVTLNSVYYSTVKIDASAPHYLKDISGIGEGAFIIADSHRVLKLEDVIDLPSVSCQK